MQLIRWYNLRDIKEYEESTRDSILEYFKSIKDIRVDKVLSLVSLGNGKCSIEEAAEILDQYLQNNSFFDAILEIKEQLLGKESVKEEPDEERTLDTKEYDTLTELYMHFWNQLGQWVSYSEFWSMTTTEMYRVFENVQLRYINEENQRLKGDHTLAAMIGAAVWGKLQRKAPHVELPENQVDSGELMAAKLKAWANSVNYSNSKRGGE